MYQKFLNHFAKALKIYFVFCAIMIIVNNTANAQGLKVKVGLTAMYPPFEYREKGRLVGYDVDLIKAIAKEMGWELAFKDMPFDELISALNNKEVDLVISAFNLTPQRQKTLSISHVYYSQNQLVWLYLKSHLFAKDKDLNGRKVGVHGATVLEKWARDQINAKNQFQLISFYSTPLLIEKLRDNDVDVAIVEEVQAIEYIEHDPSLTYEYTGSHIGGYVIAFKKGSPWVNKVNKVLDKLKSEGFLAINEEKWIKNTKQ